MISLGTGLGDGLPLRRGAMAAAWDALTLFASSQGTIIDFTDPERAFRNVLGTQSAFASSEPFALVTNAVYPTEIGSATPINASVGKPAYASSFEVHQDGDLTAGFAFDGDYTTRWSSEFSDYQWIYVDLGSRHQIASAKIHWNTSYAKDYNIQVSDDAISWTTIYSVVESAGGLSHLPLAANGRYVRIECLRRATTYGHSIHEFEVFAFPTETPDAGGHAGQTASEKMPLLEIDGNGVQRAVFDGVDDALEVRLPDLGSQATIVRADDTGVHFTEGQTISGAYSIANLGAQYVHLVIDRPLSEVEKASLEVWMRQKARL